MIHRIILRLEVHKETNLTKVLDLLQDALITAKVDGEINGYEIRDERHGGRRLRSG